MCQIPIQVLQIPEICMYYVHKTSDIEVGWTVEKTDLTN